MSLKKKEDIIDLCNIILKCKIRKTEMPVTTLVKKIQTARGIVDCAEDGLGQHNTVCLLFYNV